MKTSSFLNLIHGVQEEAFNWEIWGKLDITEKVIQLPQSSYDTIKTEETEKVTSHQCEMTKHEEGHHTHWGCDRVQGAGVCLGKSRIGHGKYIEAWRCDKCDFDLCINCMRINKFIDNRESKKEATPEVPTDQDKKEETKEIEVLLSDLLKEEGC